MKYKHRDKNGNVTELKDLELGHLKNIISFIKRRAEEGITVFTGMGGTCADDMWCDEETLYGKEARKAMHYKKYVKELKRRNKQRSKHDNY